MPKSVCHISLLHFRYDLRIVTRECLSLVRNGFDVHYILNDGRGQENFEGLHIHDLNAPVKTIKRFLITHFQCLRLALKLRADIYHFHDPELMIIGAILKFLGKKVIADVHEDVPNQVKGSVKKNKIAKHIHATVISRLEKWTFPFLDAVITSSPYVENKLRPHTKKIINIACFPDLRYEFLKNKQEKDKQYDLVYAGSISPLRGIIETLDMLEGTDYKFALAGDFQGEGLEENLKNKPSWIKNTTYLGYIENRTDYVDLLSAAKIGMANLQNNPNFETIYCIKMFEYMAAGIPQIATNFKHWKKWFEQYDCILFVDSDDRYQLRQAVSALLNQPKKAQEMGRNGRKAVETQLNWQVEEKKLLSLYHEILIID